MTTTPAVDNFADLGLSDSLLKALTEIGYLGYAARGQHQPAVTQPRGVDPGGPPWNSTVSCFRLR